MAVDALSPIPSQTQPRKQVLKTLKYIDELKPGMYVCDLDRPWVGTPFLMQGFQIVCPEEIEQIGHYCKFVFIDELRSIKMDKQRFEKRKTLQELFPNTKLTSYKKERTWLKEIPEAEKALDSLTASSNSIIDSFKNGTPFNIIEVKKNVGPMIDSVLRNPDASMWLARLKDKDDYIYRHSISCSVWAVALGREIGLPRHDLRTLAIGALLFDIGKTRLPTELLTKKTELTEEERALIKRHVEEGVDAVKEIPGIAPEVVDIVKYHHERFDGSGYPYQLKGLNIPVMARIAAIVDCYDAMTSERHWVLASSPSMVVRKLYAWRGTQFQTELVEAFIKAVGLYPAGTIVQLSTKEIGIVTEENQEQRLRPKLIMLLNREKKPYPKGLYIDLANIEVNSRGEKLNIVKSLEPGTYGIDPKKIDIALNEE